MKASPLIPFWITTPTPRSPIGFGVTAFSLPDALRILREAGYELPEDTAQLQITEGIKFSDLDQNHIVPNMGPIVVRGIWFPFTSVGT